MTIQKWLSLVGCVAFDVGGLDELQKQVSSFRRVPDDLTYLYFNTSNFAFILYVLSDAVSNRSDVRGNVRRQPMENLWKVTYAGNDLCRHRYDIRASLNRQRWGRIA